MIQIIHKGNRICYNVIAINFEASIRQRLWRIPKGVQLVWTKGGESNVRAWWVSLPSRLLRAPPVRRCVLLHAWAVNIRRTWSRLVASLNEYEAQFEIGEQGGE